MGSADWACQTLTSRHQACLLFLQCLLFQSSHLFAPGWPLWCSEAQQVMRPVSAPEPPGRQRFSKCRQIVVRLVTVFVDVQMGSVHTVTVKRLLDFGAIVEFPTGSSTLLHISNLSHTRVSFGIVFPLSLEAPAHLALAIQALREAAIKFCQKSCYCLMLCALLLVLCAMLHVECSIWAESGRNTRTCCTLFTSNVSLLRRCSKIR